MVKEHRSRKKEAVASSSSFSKWVFGKLRDGNHIHSLARAQSAFSTELVAHIRLQDQKTAFYSIIIINECLCCFRTCVCCFRAFQCCFRVLNSNSCFCSQLHTSVTFFFDQTMTKAEHKRPIPKLFDNRPSALATEVFCETIGLVIYIQNIPIIVSFSLLLS